MARQYINFCEGTLNAGITDAATTVYVNFAANSAIPDDTSWAGADYMVMAIDPEAVQHQPELVKVTAISGSSNPYTLTVARGGTEAETSSNLGGGAAAAWDSGRKVVFPATALSYA
tara:strand:+ start:204 stop:551 length:348 start_codon:yes stop_codon:yes gene_type:complete